MPKVTATKRFEFCAAHHLEGYDGLCGNIHGHNFVLEVTIVRFPHYTGVKLKGGNDRGMVMEFGDIKTIVQPMIDRLDHSHIVEYTEDSKFTMKIVEIGERPTTENLALYLYRKIVKELPHGVTLDKIKLRETRTGWVEVTNDGS